MKSAQESQISREFVPMDVNASSRCSTFTFSDVIHRVCSKLDLSISAVNRLR